MAEIVFEDEKGMELEVQDILPYSLDAPSITLEDADYGIWYLHIQEHPELYLDKTISFKVQFPELNEGVLLQYAFSLVDKDKSFYTSDTLANSMSVELTSTINNGTAAALSATASKKAAGSASRTFLQSLTTSMLPTRHS